MWPHNGSSPCLDRHHSPPFTPHHWTPLSGEILSQDDSTTLKQQLSQAIIDSDENSLRTLLDDHSLQHILTLELDSEGLNLLGSIAQYALNDWLKYKDILIMLIEEYGSQQYDHHSLDLALQHAFVGNLTFDGFFLPTFDVKCCEYLVSLGARIQFTESYRPKFDDHLGGKDPDTSYILLLLTVSSPTEDIPNALWFYKVFLGLFHHAPSLMCVWFPILYKYASSTKRQFLEHPLILRHYHALESISCNKNSPLSQPSHLQRLIVASWNLQGISLRDQLQLRKIANAIVGSHCHLIALQGLADNRILLDLNCQLGPDWSFLLSPQIRSQNGRHYSESVGFLYMNYLVLSDHGFTPCYVDSHSGLIQNASWKLGSGVSQSLPSTFTVLNIHLPSNVSSFRALSKIGQLLQKIPTHTLESVVLVSNLSAPNGLDDWQPVRELGFIPCFESTNGIRNLKSALSSTSLEALRVYDNIWIHRQSKSDTVTSGVNTDTEWESGHNLIMTKLDFQLNSLEDTSPGGGCRKSLFKSFLDDWSFVEPSWEDLDIFENTLFPDDCSNE